MALIKCEDCGHDMSDKAEACPHCGCPNPKIKEFLDEQESNRQYLIDMINISRGSQGLTPLPYYW